MKQTIKLNESQLRKIVKESVKKIIREECENDTDSYEEIDGIIEEVSSLDEDDAFKYIIDNENSGLEVELPCGIHFGVGLYAWRDAAVKYLPSNMLIPMRNNLFVSLENPKILRTYIKNAFEKNGTLCKY